MLGRKQLYDEMDAVSTPIDIANGSHTPETVRIKSSSSPELDYLSEIFASLDHQFLSAVLESTGRHIAAPSDAARTCPCARLIVVQTSIFRLQSTPASECQITRLAAPTADREPAAARRAQAAFAVSRGRHPTAARCTLALGEMTASGPHTQAPRTGSLERPRSS